MKVQSVEEKRMLYVLRFSVLFLHTCRISAFVHSVFLCYSLHTCRISTFVHSVFVLFSLSMIALI